MVEEQRQNKEVRILLTKWQEAGSLLGGILAAHFTCLLDFMPLCLLVGLKFGLHGVLTDCSISDKKGKL